MADGIEFYGLPSTQETIHFAKMFDRVFDCLNGQNLTECILRRKPDLRPYKSPDDPRLQVTRTATDFSIASVAEAGLHRLSG